MATVDLLRPLAGRQLDLFRVDHDDVIAVVDVGRPGRLRAALEGARDPYRERAEPLPGRVDDVPLVIRLGRLLLIGAHRSVGT